MKHFNSLKVVAFAAASLIAVSAHSQTLAIDGSGAVTSFAMSDNWLGVNSLLFGPPVQAVAPASLTVSVDDSYGTVTGTPFSTYVSGVSAPLTSFALNSNNEVGSIAAQGGLTLSFSPSTAATGGALTINNLSYDLATNTISADVSGQALNGYTLATTHEQLFSVRTLEYSTDGGYNWTTVAESASFAIPGPGVYDIRASGLFLVGGNQGTVFSQLQQSFGLKGIGLASYQVIDTYDDVPTDMYYNTSGFGTFSAHVTVLPAVPEPTAFAVFGCGLAVMVGASRRRQVLARPV